MHIALVQREYDNTTDSPRDLLAKHFTIVDWANALTEKDVTVTVIYRFHSNHRFVINEVLYIFINNYLPPKLKYYYSLRKFYSRVNAILKTESIQILHFHNLKAFFPNFLIKRFFKSIPILLQDHGSVVSSDYTLFNRIKFFLYNISLKNIDAFVFAAQGQEMQFTSLGILPADRCYFVMENSSKFKFKNRVKSREITKMGGCPIFLWVGNLDYNKDPLTVLSAFKDLLKHQPDSKLYMIYRFKLIENEVKVYIDESHLLKESVILLGRKKRDDLESYYNSSDYILSSSHKEGSGYSVIEAMSCGVIPILSRIPSFIDLTNDGEIGALFQVCNQKLLVSKIIELMKKPIVIESEKVLKQFQNKLSFDTISNDMIKVYEELLKCSKSGN